MRCGNWPCATMTFYFLSRAQHKVTVNCDILFTLITQSADVLSDHSPRLRHYLSRHSNKRGSFGPAALNSSKAAVRHQEGHRLSNLGYSEQLHHCALPSGQLMVNLRGFLLLALPLLPPVVIGQGRPSPTLPCWCSRHHMYRMYLVGVA